VVDVEAEREEVVVVMAHPEAAVLLIHLVEAFMVVLHLLCTAAVLLLMATDLHHLAERKRNSLSQFQLQSADQRDYSYRGGYRARGRGYAPY